MRFDLETNNHLRDVSFKRQADISACFVMHFQNLETSDVAEAGHAGSHTFERAGKEVKKLERKVTGQSAAFRFAQFPPAHRCLLPLSTPLAYRKNCSLSAVADAVENTVQQQAAITQGFH